VKKLILLTIATCLFSLNLPIVHADWDPVREAQDAAERKANQERSAREKAAVDKRKREATQKHQREFLGKDAAGKSDAEVDRLYTQRRQELEKQATAMEAAMRADKKKPQKSGLEGDMAQADAAMKSMYGKSTSDIGNMSPQERDAFMKDLEKKYAK
jgi:hypothetical protein